MSSAERRLAKAREARNAARTAFDNSLAQLRGDTKTQTIAERVTARLGDDARSALHQALDIAGESKGIIAGTVAVLALWFLRHPFIRWVEQKLGDPAAESESDD